MSHTIDCKGIVPIEKEMLKDRINGLKEKGVISEYEVLSDTVEGEFWRIIVRIYKRGIEYRCGEGSCDYLKHYGRLPLRYTIHCKHY